jgi:ribonuclease HI
MAADSRRIAIYTDGGAKPNPGPGGWGAVMLPAGEGEGAEARELSGGARHTTNNRMELTAAIRALEALSPGTRARLYTDSQYLRLGITDWLPGWVARGWRKRDGGAVENADLWRRLAALADSHDLEWTWVRGHAGNKWNARADALATAARRSHGGAPARAAAATPGEPAAAEAPPAATIFVKVSCRGGTGGWAARVCCGDDEKALSGRRTDTSANRLDLEAASEALAALPPGPSAAVYTGSEYLRQGAVNWLPAWRLRGWRTKDGGEVKNRDAWERLGELLKVRSVVWPEVDEAARAEIERLEEAARPDSERG